MSIYVLYAIQIFPQFEFNGYITNICGGWLKGLLRYDTKYLGQSHIENPVHLGHSNQSKHNAHVHPEPPSFCHWSNGHTMFMNIISQAILCKSQMIDIELRQEILSNSNNQEHQWHP